jgi:hypothetical protein
LEIDFETKRRQVRLEMERRRKLFVSKRARLNDDRNFEMQIVAADSALLLDVVDVLNTMEEGVRPNFQCTGQKRAIQAFIRKANFMISQLFKRLWMACEETKCESLKRQSCQSRIGSGV